MHVRTDRRGRNLVAAAATIGLLGLPLLTSPAEAAGTEPPAVTVMSRNVYLGADIMRPIVAMKTAQAQPGASQLSVLSAFANANDMTQDIAFQTDFPTRAKLLASELVDNQPDLVGLQEVALWRHQEDAEGNPMIDKPGGPAFLIPNAAEVDYDFLAILREELRNQGEPYKVLSVNTLSDVEGPAWEGRFGLHTNARDVRLTMRDVILVRKDSTLSVVKGSAAKGTYATNMPPIEVSGKTIEFKRGYQSVDLLAGKRKFRFINTHLEAFSSDVAFRQAKQLLAGPGSYPGTAIIACDCNSDPLNGSIKDGDTKKHWAPYRLFTGKGGFTDQWLEWAPAEEGWTSGLSEAVDDDTAAGFDHRIDLVMARTATGDKLPVVSGDVTGDEVADKDADTGLWPSDHAGVVMKLRLR